MLSALFLFRYGHIRAPRRECGFGGGWHREMELRSNEGFNRLRGYSKDTDGNTLALGFTTTTRRTWDCEPFAKHGYHRPEFISLRSSPDADNLTLRFISGDQTTNKYILRWLHFKQWKDLL